MIEIDKYFTSIEHNGESVTLVLSGMAGSGKTQMALYYCRQSRNSKSFAGTLWIDGTTLTTANESLAKASQTLFSSRADAWNAEQTKREVFGVIQNSSSPWVVVFDNYDDPKAYDIDQLLPQKQRGRRLTIITSRTRSARSVGISVQIGELNEDEALKLLLGKKSQVMLNKAYDHGRDIVKRLGNLALAIAQARAYVDDRNMDLAFFIQQYEDEQERIHKALPQIWTYSRRNSDAEEPRSLCIATTWELTVNILSDDLNDKEAKTQLLVTSAFLGLANITEDIFAVYAETSNNLPPWMFAFLDQENRRLDRAHFQEAIAEMGRLCLFQYYELGAQGITWRFHPVVQDWAMNRQAPEKKQAFTLLAAEILRHSLDRHKPMWSRDENTPRTLYSNYNSLHPHVITCHANCQKLLPPSDHPDTRKAANGLWRVLIAQLHVEEASKVRRKYSLVLNDSEQEMLREALEKIT